MLKVALVTNQPAPYRMPVFNFAHKDGEMELHVMYCCRRESNRSWQVPETAVPHTYLSGFEFNFRGRSVHCNPSIWSALSQQNPDVVITTGFNPTHLLAFAWCRIQRIKHLVMTDGSIESEASLTPIHRWVRRVVYARSQAFLAASDSGLRIYDSYGISKDRQFKSCLAAESIFAADRSANKIYDLMFCGRFEHVKQPAFAIQVADALSKLLGRKSSLLMVGSGPLQTELEEQASHCATRVQVTFTGFVHREQLPRHYNSTRVLVVPSRWEPWGLVVNEALACGLYVLASPQVGAGRELLTDPALGLVMDSDVNRWAQAASKAVQSTKLGAEASRNRRLKDFTSERAAQGITAAVRTASKKTVVILQRRLPHYRVSFFEGLRALLGERDIHLELMHGDPAPSEISKRDSATLDWAHRLRTAYVGNLCVQSLKPQVLDAEMVVCPHESGYLLTQRLLLARRRGKLAFWGHGRNMNANTRFWSEHYKRVIAPRADWWFAYTQLTKDYLVKARVPTGKITVVNNSVATQAGDQPPPAKEGPTAAYLGSLYEEKRIPFLIEACDAVVSLLPDFRLHVIGAGPQEDFLRRQAQVRPWLTLHGALTGSAKQRVLLESQVLLCPGLVGLAIVDGFGAGLPLLTTDLPIHSPEIGYLSNGVNGLSTPHQVESYSGAIIGLLSDPRRLQRMQNEAFRSGQTYTVDNMVKRFAEGIMSCLAAEK